MDLHVHKNEILYNSNNLFLQIRNESKQTDRAMIIFVEKS